MFRIAALVILARSAGSTASNAWAQLRSRPTARPSGATGSSCASPRWRTLEQRDQRDQPQGRGRTDARSAFFMPTPTRAASRARARCSRSRCRTATGASGDSDRWVRITASTAAAEVDQRRDLCCPEVLHAGRCLRPDLDLLSRRSRQRRASERPGPLWRTDRAGSLRHLHGRQSARRAGVHRTP